LSRFLACLRAGRAGEDAVGRLLGPHLGFTPNESKKRADLARWDFRFTLDGADRFGEVKYDRMESSTGNVAVEHYNPRAGRPSGLMATRAEVWFLVLERPRTVWAASVGRLKAYCRDVRPHREVEWGGDANASLWLYPTGPLLSACFVELTNATPRRAAELLRSVLADAREEAPA
jgi:hypothetical protein